MQNDTTRKVLSEISGKASWAGINYGMRTILVENESEVRKYWMKVGSEVADGTMVQAGDQLGIEGDIPMLIPVGALRYRFPKTMARNSETLCTIEGDCFSANGRYYALRIRFMIKENGDEFGDPFYLEQEVLEENFYRADETILTGRKISNITSFYSFHENELPSDEDDTPLPVWLENMRQQKRIQFKSPYEILARIQLGFDDFRMAFERRHRREPDENTKGIKTEKKEKCTPEQYRDAAVRVIEHDRAFENCLQFLINHATPCPEEFEPGSNAEVLINTLVTHHEAKEDYFTCAKLLRLKNGFKIPKELGTVLNTFMRNSETVLHYERNILICWHEVELLGMLALVPHIKKKDDDIDSLILVEKMLDYFQQKKEFQKCEVLTLMKQRINFKRQQEYNRQKRNNP